jgi:uncharacterized protein YjiK
MNGFLKVGLIVSAITIPVIFFWNDLTQIFDNKLPVSSASIAGGDKDKDKKDKKDKKKEDKEEDTDAVPSDDIRVLQKWELPSQLTEVSGIEYLNANQFACIQDELGHIFIYNTASQKIEKEIPFGEPGDYEGIAVAGNTAYVMRADGKLFEVANYMSAKPTVQQYSTPLNQKQDVEGLAYDKKNNRLLLAIKGNEPNTQDYKGIYAFDLRTKKMVAEPVYKVDLTHQIWKDVKGKKAGNKMQPSDLAVHPTTGDIYITDGANPKLLIMDANGKKKEVHPLSKSAFEQPEGISFTPDGELFISSEGGNGAGVIAKVEVVEN